MMHLEAVYYNCAQGPFWHTCEPPGPIFVVLRLNPLQRCYP